MIQDIQLNLGYNFIGSKVFSTYLKDPNSQQSRDTTYRTITQNQVYLEPIISLNRFRNFSLSLALPFMAVKINRTEAIANREWQVWSTPSINLMYYSKRKSSNKIFLRYNRFINLTDKDYGFTQIQLGYSANISELLGSGTK